MLIVYRFLGDTGLGLHDRVVVVDRSSRCGAGQVAGNRGRVVAFSAERAAIQAAGGDLYLRDAAVGENLDLFGTALTGIFGAVGLAVVEDVPFPVCLDHTTVVVAEGVDRNGASIKTDIAVGNDCAAVDKAAVRAVAGRIAELMALMGRVDKVVFFADLADGGRLKKSMSFKSGTCGMVTAGNQHAGRFLQGEHIGFQFGDHAVFTELNIHQPFHRCAARFGDLFQLLFGQFGELHFLFGGRRKAIVEIHPSIVIGQHRRVKRHEFPQDLTVGIMDMAVKCKRSGGRIADRNPDLGIEGEAIIQIIPSIRAASDIRRPELHLIIRI